MHLVTVQISQHKSESDVDKKQIMQRSGFTVLRRKKKKSDVRIKPSVSGVMCVVLWGVQKLSVGLCRSIWRPAESSREQLKTDEDEDDDDVAFEPVSVSQPHHLTAENTILSFLGKPNMNDHIQPCNYI